MADFIFSCPYCNQNIQCDSTCAGMPITCPACKKPIVMMPTPAAKPKSKIRQVVLIVALVMMFLVGFGIGDWVGSRTSKTAAIRKGNQMLHVAGSIEGEGMKTLSCTGGNEQAQIMNAFGMKWSDNAQLWWTGAKPGDHLELALPALKAGKYQLLAQFTKAGDYGIVQLSLNDRELGDPLDFYNDGVIPTGNLDLGVWPLSAGEHKLGVTITGANPRAVKMYMFGLDYVKLVEKK